MVVSKINLIPDIINRKSYCHRWLQINVPYYLARVQEALKPALNYISRTVSQAITWFLEVSAPARAQIGVLINFLLVKVKDIYHLSNWFIINCDLTQHEFLHTGR